MKAKYWDISPLVSPRLAVFPGDTPFSRKVLMDYKSGAHLELSSFQGTVHLGAHADSPSHYSAKGRPCHELDLSRYYGRVQIIRVQVPRGERIMPEHLLTGICEKRVLFCTESYPDPNLWNDDFNSLSCELVHFLADSGVILVGIDTPSVDPSESKKLEAHSAIYQRDLSILEGVVLKGIPEGSYKLMALPLSLQDFEASPVRAILLPLEENLES